MVIGGAFVRFFVSLLFLTAYHSRTKGFVLAHFWHVVISAAAIAVFGGLLEAGLKPNSPLFRGVLGFGSTAVMLYFAELVIPAMKLPYQGLWLTALVVGVIDLILPMGMRRRAE